MGASGAGASTVIFSPSKIRTSYAIRLELKCTNNIAEYEALLLALRKLKALGIKRAYVKTDSKVIAEHVEKEYKAKDPMLEKYLQAICRMEAHFVGFIATHIPRSENKEADTLAKAAAQNTPLPAEVFSKTIKAPSIELQGREILSISPNHSED